MADGNPPLIERLAQDPLIIDVGAKDLFTGAMNWIISHEHADEIMSESGAAAGSDEDFWPMADDWRAQFRPYVVKNGVLQIPVMGVLLNRFPWQLGRWATGYTYIEKAWKRGLADPNVRGIAYIHDSPGGEVAGNFELNDKLFAARGVKPQRSFAADHSYSASYSLASAPGPISITRSGGCGSIGVITMHFSYAKMLDKLGIEVTFIFKGKHKKDGNAYEALPADVKERIEARIDRIYGVFTSAVARNRNMDEKDVRATEALTYDAQDAISIGLADRIGSLEEELVLFSDEISIGDEQMATDTTVQGVPQATHDAAVATARAEGVTAGRTEGATAERDRIKAIFATDEAKKRPMAARQVALETDLSVEKAKGFLAGMPEEKQGVGATRNHFAEAMNRNGGADVGGGEEGNGDQTETPAATSNRILDNYAAASGKKRNKAA